MMTGKVAALLNPTSVAILGARENPMGWTARIFANYQRFDFEGPVWPINPNFAEIWGVPCFPKLSELPGVPDHLVVMRAAKFVPQILREAAAIGSRSATIYAAGFSELGTKRGIELEEELREAIEETGLAVCGPNCLGSLSARGRSLSLPDDRIRELIPGPVAMVGQSGTTTPGLGRTLIDRGIDVGYIVTSGNETGLTTSDYINYFVEDKDVKVIFCLIEAVRRPQDFLKACRRARDARKPVIALKMGLSDKGRAAAMAHTGSMAGSIEAFDAVAGESGVIRVESGDAAADLIEFFIHSDLPQGKGVGVLVYSGGVRGLSLDAAHRNDILLPDFSPQTAAKFRKILGEKLQVSNPLDAPGFMNMPLEAVVSLMEAIQEDPAIGTVLFQEDLPRDEGMNEANIRRTTRVLSTMEAFDQKFLQDGGKPIGLISPASADLTDFSRQARKKFSNISLMNEPERAFRTLRYVNSYRDQLRNAGLRRLRKTRLPSRLASDSLLVVREQKGAPFPLNEPESKALLEAYDIPIPKEAMAKNTPEAVKLATSIGFPVVVKGVASALTHKSEAGAVKLSLVNEVEVEQACKMIKKNVKNFDSSIKLEGWLVSKFIPTGLELVFGIQRDPEMESVVMFGLGGVWLEMFKDVTFARPGFGEEKARAMIEQTRVGALLRGYRGTSPFDRQTVVDTLISVGRLAADGGDKIESLDINPFIVLPEGKGGFAVDALVVLAPRERTV